MGTQSYMLVLDYHDYYYQLKERMLLMLVRYSTCIMVSKGDQPYQNVVASDVLSTRYSWGGVGMFAGVGYS